jgi:hypothetical protein
MTTKINIIHTPDNIEEIRRAELERLTGCPIHHVIEGTCREPGCQNAALQLQKDLVLSDELCLRLRETALQGGGRLLADGTPPQAEMNSAPSYTKDAAPIFQTKPRMRCVL